MADATPRIEATGILSLLGLWVDSPTVNQV